jgi:hypothetical protein
MAPFEMLYGRRCRTPLFWNETGNGRFLDPTSQDAKRQVHMAREKLRIAQ